MNDYAHELWLLPFWPARLWITQETRAWWQIQALLNTNTSNGATNITVTNRCTPCVHTDVMQDAGRIIITNLKVRVRVALRLTVYRQSVRLGDKPLETHDETCSFFSTELYVTSSLTRGQVCRLQLVLGLASAVVLKSDSRGTQDPILLPQIRDSPNLEGQVPVFISPRNRVARLFPLVRVSLFVASYYSAVGIATGYERPRGRSSSPGTVKNFLFSTSSRPALGSTEPPIQWVLGASSPGVNRPGPEADHSQLVPRSRRYGSIHPLPHTPSWHSA
jgi:hypothetical protein